MTAYDRLSGILNTSSNPGWLQDMFIADRQTEIIDAFETLAAVRPVLFENRLFELPTLDEKSEVEWLSVYDEWI